MRIRRNSAISAIASVAVLAGACHRPEILGGRGAAPTGQVVAKVAGREITLRELQAELNGVNVTNPKQAKAVQQRALQLIVLRTLLADEARKQGLDKTPDFALQQQRAIDGLLAQSLEQKIAKAVPAPAPEEVQRFISANTNIFSERKILDVDQIRFARPADPAILKGLTPLSTQDQVVAYLTRLQIPFARANATLDVVGMDPRIVDAIMKLPAGDLFVIPSGDAVLVDAIRATRVVPLTGNDATTYATNLLKRQHLQEAVQRGIGDVVSKGMKHVQFNPAYAPPAPMGTAPTAGAAAASTNAITKSVAAP
jgi:peptidyl-prolyl cis-trans isomerase C